MNQEPVAGETTSHSFIVKITIQDTAPEARHTTWRGSITHVPDGARRHFLNLETMADFVGDFIEGMGGDAGLIYGLRKKTRRWQRFFHVRFWSAMSGWFH